MMIYLDKAAPVIVEVWGHFTLEDILIIQSGVNCAWKNGQFSGFQEGQKIDLMNFKWIDGEDGGLCFTSHPVKNTTKKATKKKGDRK